MRVVVFLVLLLNSFLAWAEVDKLLQTQLLKMAEQGQQIRQSLVQQQATKSVEALKVIASEIATLHTQTLKEMVALHGWPNKNLVEEKGVQAAFQVVQHSPDLAFQQDMLPLIIQSYLNKDGIAGHNVAELTDLVSLKLGKKQVFGTQTKWVDGKVVFAPIENEQAVDQLRAEMGMSTLAEFEKQLSGL